MRVKRLLAALLEHGAVVWAEGDELVCRAPAGVLDPDLRRELGAAKGELLALLGDRRRHAPLSSAQERFWFLQQLEPESRAYNQPAAWVLRGRLDARALERALEEVRRRHDVLRATFKTVDERPCQVVAPPGRRRRLPLVDLAGLYAARREDEARRLLRREADRPFDLAVGPSSRFLLLRLERARHVLYRCFHHAVIDAGSQNVWRRELTILYDAYSEGREAVLPELSLQYDGYAARQRHELRGEKLDALLAWWREALAGAPPFELAADRKRPVAPSYRGAGHGFRVSERLAGALRRLGRGEGATLFMTLLAAFLTLLHRLSGRDDVTVGSPVAGRHEAGVEDLIGFFVNTLALRGRPSGRLSFRDFLHQVRESCRAAYAHQELPFEVLVEALQPERDLARSPLFQVLFVLHDAPGEEMALRELTLSPFELGVHRAPFDLTLTLSEEDGALAGLLSYDADLYQGTTAARLARSLTTLLADAAEDPERQLDVLSLLSASERHQLLLEWNDTAVGATEATVVEAFERQVAATPEAVAVVFGGERLTYRELDEQAERLAAELYRRGVRRDDRVGLFLERSLEMAVAVVGTLKAGAAYVPLDPAYPRERLDFMTEEIGGGVVLTDVSLRDEDGVPPAGPDPEGLAYVIYTSGSTGRPKGIALAHRALWNLIAWHLETLLPAARTLQYASLSFDASFHEMFAAWCSGGTVYVVGEEMRRDVAALARYLAAERIEKAILPVVVLQRLAEECLESGLDLGSLRELVTTGEQLHVTPAVEELFRRFPQVAFHNHYGPSETHVVTAARLGRKTGTHPPIGRPIAATEIYLVERGGLPAVLGQVGELLVGGLSLARGYLGRPARTAERFVPDRFGGRPGGRLYRTGDHARYLGDGRIEFLGRMDLQVKIRGFRVEPEEVEAVLVRHPGVREAAVVVHGGGASSSGAFLAAFYVAEKETSATELKAFVAERLPEPMVPRSFEALAELPLSPTGKLDRAALVRRPLPELAGASSRPRSGTEEILLGIWEDVLGRRGLGVRDPFFESGGHSLLATRLVSRIRRSFSVEVPVRSVFERPTVAELAAEVDDRRRAGAPRGPVPPPLVARPPDTAELPLSFAQQRLWFLQQLRPASAAYNLPDAWRLRGRLDTVALRRALGEIVRRHEVLRTRLPARDGRPFQEIQAPGTWALPSVDLTSLPSRLRPVEARRRLTAEGRRPFRLEAELPLRSHLWHLGAGEYVLFVNTHHVASDGWSQGIMDRELTVLYEAFARRAASPLPELRIQYADFSLWQRAWLQGELLETQIVYWRSRLDGMRTLELPTDRPRSVLARTQSGAGLPLCLSEELSRSLRQLSVEAGASLFMTLLAAFVALLHRLTGQSDVAVGSPIANRRYEEVEDLIGSFVNTLVLRSRPRSRLSFLELLSQVRDLCLEAYLHQDLPFEKLVEELDPDRDLFRSPFFQVMLALQNAPHQDLSLGEIVLSGFSLGALRPHFDWTVSFQDHGQEIAGWLRYDADLFDATSMKRLARCLQLLCESLAEDPGRSLESLALLGAAERHQLLWEWSGAPARGREACLGELFLAQAEQTPDRLALVGGEEAWTYRELALRARELAGRLRRTGVGPETVVGVTLESCPETVAAILAILLAGGAYLPLDLRTPLRRRQRMLEESRAAAVVTRREIAVRSPPTAASGQAVPGNAAYVLYTSGSSGQPKGVVVEHRQVLSYVYAVRERLALSPGASFALVQPFSVDSSKTTLYPPLLSGGSIHLVEERDATDPEVLARLFRRQRIDVLKIAPSHLAALAEAAGGLPWVPAQALVIGGEAWPGGWAKRWGEALQRCRVYNHYGPTEVTVGTHAHRVTDPEAAPCVGRPLGNSEAYVVDAQLRPVAAGVPGELLLGGAGLARGYLGRPGRTAASFLPHPFTAEPGARIYRSGDIARFRHGGTLELLGRRDEQVKIRGFRVEPGEVEAALSDHPGVAGAAVVARGVPARLVVYLRAASAPAPGLAELRRFLRPRLPEHMLPEASVVLAELPRTPHGKIDRGRLPEPAASEAGDLGTEELPRTPSEEILTEVWEQLLGRRGIGIRDDFFQLGGHSLLATQVVARIRRLFGVELPVRSIFERPTIAALSAEMDSRRRAGAPGEPLPPLVARSPGTPRPPRSLVPRSLVPLSFAQQRLWFLQQLRPRSATYNMPGARCLLGCLDTVALGRALGEIVRRHEVLRTRLPALDGQPYQEVLEAGSWSLPLVDLASLPPPRRPGETRRRLAAEGRRPFRLEAEPPLRSHLWRLGAEEHVLFVNTHHVCSDGWSQGVLNRELTRLYGAYAAGEPSPLPELGIQYADFAVWQREWLSGGRASGGLLEAQLAYWRRQLDGLQALELPADRPRPAVGTPQGASLSFVLPEGLGRSLRKLSFEAGASLFMTLLSAFAAWLHRLTGQNDIAVGAPIANRRSEEVEGLIGFFVNTLVLRSRPERRKPFRELLSQVREVCLEAYRHQDLPFERLVEDLRPERDLRYHAPLVQVMLALQNTPRPAPELPGLEVRPFLLGSMTTYFDLTLFLSESGDGLRVTLDYSTDLFQGTTAERFAGSYARLLASVAEDPDGRLGELALLSAGERHQSLLEWNDRTASRSEEGAHRLFEVQAARSPLAVALVEGRKRTTYAELDRLASFLSGRLENLGVHPGDRVALLAERSTEGVVAMLAVLKVGAAYVPLDHGYPRERLAYMLRDAGVTLLLTRLQTADVLPEEATPRATIEELLEGAAQARAVPGRDTGGDHLAYVMYTSGSTGRPKGVAVTHRGIVRLVRGNDYARLADDEVFLHLAPAAFDASTLEIWGPLLNGGRLVLAPPGPVLPGDLERLIRRHGVTSLWLTAGLFHVVTQERPEAFRPLRQLLAGGDVLSPKMVRRALAELGGGALVNGYGPTESTTFACCQTVRRPGPAGPVPIGRPIRGTRAYVVDADLVPVPAGVAGELLIGGEGLARGYWNRPSRTAEAFVPDPFAGPTAQGERLYRSGDRVRHLPDGTLLFLGRRDDQVKIRGFRVEPAEVAAHLRRHPGVREAAVVATEGPDGNGTGERSLVAYVVPQPTSNGGREHLERWRTLYDDLYRPAPIDSFETVGWNSSYTGRPIPAAEMQEWLEATVERILRLKAGDAFRVLEIGCGTGMLLRRVAPQATRYLGTDFSQTVLDRLTAQLAPENGFAHVRLEKRLADDFRRMDEGAFDVVVLNSTVQYFPGIDYLREVLRGAVQSTAPGGFIFLGDLRNLALFDAYCASVELHKADGSLSLDELRRRIRRRRLGEEELLVAPGFFHALRRELPRIGRVRVEPKRGQSRNELNLFRYDVTLELDVQVPEVVEPEELPRETTLDGLRRHLERHRPEAAVWKAVPNPRLSGENELLAALAEPMSLSTVSQLRGRLDQATPHGVEGEDIRSAARELGYHAELSWAAGYPDGSYDALLLRGRSPAAFVQPVPPENPRRGEEGNDPLRASAARSLAARLREALAEQLPEHMIPSHLVFPEGLPLTANGKLDRRALAEEAPLGASGHFTSPRGQVEEALARDLADLLGVERVGAHDDFFELGGHSLMAVQWMSRIEKRFAVQLPLDVLFRAPTVAGLALALESRRQAVRSSPLVALQPGTSAPPFFCVHPAGGHVLCFVSLCRELGPGRPFYGLEARGRNGEEPLPEDLESMAADYVSVIRAARPHGPYLLGGWSMGGVVAYEMARQLRAAGAEVALLALIDSRPPAGGEQRPAHLRATSLELFARDLGLVETGDLEAQVGDALEQILEAARNQGLLADDVDTDHMHRLYRLFERNVRILLRYSAGPYEGRITLFRSRRNAARGSGTGWEELAAGGVECFEVSGDHFSMLRPPHVRALAERLGESLQRALDAAGGP